VKKKALMLVAGWLIAAGAGCAPVHQDYARSALAEGRVNDALSEIQMVLARHPDEPQAKNLAARIYTAAGVRLLEKKNIEGATRDFRKAIEYDPNYGAAYDYLGQIAFEQGAWASAISYGTQGAELQNHAIPSYVAQARSKLGPNPSPPAKH
jgi:tetratricopeptide (TPR) repeat protein